MFGVNRSNAEDVDLNVPDASIRPILYDKTENFCQVDWKVTIEVENDLVYLTLKQVSIDTKTHRTITDLNVSLKNWLADQDSARPYQVIKAFSHSFENLDKTLITTWEKVKTKEIVEKKTLGKNKTAHKFIKEKNLIFQLNVTCAPVYNIGTMLGGSIVMNGQSMRREK